MADLPIPFSAPMVRALVREVEAPGTGKTQTRRVITPGNFKLRGHDFKFYRPDAASLASAFHGARGFRWIEGAFSWVADPGEMHPGAIIVDCRGKPLIAPGDRLWCREEHFQFGHWEMASGKLTKGGREKWQFVPDTDEVRLDPPAEFRKGRHNADPGTPAWHKRLGRFMFRKHSRLTLYVTDVRVERLQDISEADALAEGVSTLRKEEAQGPYGETGRPPIGPAPSVRYAQLWDDINGPGAWDENPWVATYTFVPRLGNIDTLPAEARQ